MQFAPNVRFNELKWTTWFAMGVVHALRQTMFRKDLIVTSGNDGTHGKGSKHGSDDAFDCRTRDLTVDERDRLVAEIRRILNPLGYDIIDREDPNHQDHSHVEFDPKAGEAIVRVTE